MYLRTVSVLIATVALLIGWDIYAVIRGKDATISKTILDGAKRWPLIPFLMGLLMGHFFWTQW